MRGILWGLARVSLAIFIISFAVLFGTGGRIHATIGMYLICGLYLGFIGYIWCRWAAYSLWLEKEWCRHSHWSPKHPINRPWWTPFAI